MYHEIQHLKTQISYLLDQNPELRDDEELRADMLEGSTQIIEILDKLVSSEKETVSMLDAIRDRMDKLADRRSRTRQRQESIRDLIGKIMALSNLKKVTTPEGTVSMAATPISVVIIDPNAIPDEFCTFKREPSKKAIKTALENGVDVNGAALSNGGQTIRIS